ncbi:TetR/AcrR family transcriptional regulator [Kitasatospora sp. NPDC048540]|uniref:TetR/AcrR family transcriptional regulator n=1 Tax=unclassified Kitasatospora TaxID=2633591 RepID=UPI0005398CE4|nr:TetR/AcrR family transcriptional regulator [Kitasatospora sp. MBT63]
MPERSYHHGNLRTVLLDEAERALIETGVQDLSLRALARDAGVSHGAPRRHFPDRAALLEALAVRGFENLAARLTEALDGARGGFEPQLRAIAHAYVAFAIGRMPLVELMFASKHREGTDATLAAAHAAYAVPFAAISAARRRGELLGTDEQAAGRLAFATLHGLAVLLNTGMIADSDVAATVDTAVDGLLTGLAAHPGRAVGA